MNNQFIICSITRRQQSINDIAKVIQNRIGRFRLFQTTQRNIRIIAIDQFITTVGMLMNRSFGLVTNQNTVRIITGTVMCMGVHHITDQTLHITIRTMLMLRYIADQYRCSVTSITMRMLRLPANQITICIIAIGRMNILILTTEQILCIAILIMNMLRHTAG